jgi:predicted nucleic acid-binding Zn ribbon protein
VTAVHEGQPDAPAPAPERHCPRCGTTLRSDQEWCLNCGAGLGAQLAAPRGWRWPVALVGGLLALLAIAIVLALVELGKDSETITPAATPAAAATPAPTTAAAVPTPTPTPSTNPSLVPPSNGGTAATPQTSDWPAGKTGYTVMLDSSTNQATAAARAKDLAGQGIPAGVLDTSGYKPLTKDRFVVFSGQYVSRADARNALRGFAQRVTGARVVHVAPA